MVANCSSPSPKTVKPCSNDLRLSAISDDGRWTKNVLKSKSKNRLGPCEVDLIQINPKLGRIHGNPVADGWAGAVMPKPLRFQKCE